VKYPTKQEVVDKLNEIGIPREHVKGLEIWCGKNFLTSKNDAFGTYNQGVIFWDIGEIKDSRSLYLVSFPTLIHEIGHNSYRNMNEEERSKFEPFLLNFITKKKQVYSNASDSEKAKIITTLPTMFNNFADDLDFINYNIILDESFANFYRWYFYSDYIFPRFRNNPKVHLLKNIFKPFVIKSKETNISSCDLDYNIIESQNFISLYLAHHRTLIPNILNLYHRLTREE
jgi:hypothetical protein